MLRCNANVNGATASGVQSAPYSAGVTVSVAERRGEGLGMRKGRTADTRMHWLPTTTVMTGWKGACFLTAANAQCASLDGEQALALFGRPG